MELNYRRPCCIHNSELQWCIVLFIIVYPSCDNVFYLYHRFHRVVQSVTLFGEVHSCTLFTIAIDFLLEEFVSHQIVILNSCIEYKRVF
jgi:hypothetical protein